MSDTISRKESKTKKETLRELLLRKVLSKEEFD